MSKKDYEKAALICQDIALEDGAHDDKHLYAPRMVNAFVEFFRNDNPRFDSDRFRRACVPGANVKART